MDFDETTTLLREARGGDDAALSALFERYAGKLLALIRVRMGRELRSRMESRDVLQAVWLKAFSRLDQLEASSGAGVMGWLGRIAENEIRDQVEFQRRGRRDAGRDVRLESVGASLAARVRSESSRLVLEERASMLADALTRLDRDHRDVIVLRKLEELSFAEIGERLGRSPDACRMLLARGMAALTLEMERSR